ncbi:unnamed protein product [Clonostachys solani]|uniref:Uncharacterized protein n=1 Tax=Clonostachys solani TaxID=160281 RepID=A0A9N9Z2Q9_9HYPO|nr:unnamed protein product [Clonostachys solani]
MDLDMHPRKMDTEYYGSEYSWPLTIAASSTSEGVVHMLNENGAQIDGAKLDRETPFWVQSTGQMGIVPQRINVASAANRHDGNGLIALLYAIHAPIRSLARPLVDKKVDRRLGRRRQNSKY